MIRRRPLLAATGILAALFVRSSVPASAATPEASTVSLVVERIAGTPGETRRSWLERLTGAARQPTLERPYGVAWDGDDLLVTDPTARRIVRIAPSGRAVASSESEFAGPIGVAVCPIGIVVSDSQRGTVSILNQKLRESRVLAHALLRPTGVACDETRVFVVETGAHRVLSLDANGTLLRWFGQRGTGELEFNFPSAIARDRETLWVGDTLNFRIQRIEIDEGRFLQGFGALGDAAGETPRIKGIAVDTEGHLWISDAHLDQVAVFERDGRFLTDIGGRGTEPGQFSFPAGVAASRDGRIAIVDSLNRRVQVVRLTRDGKGGEP